MDRLRAIEREGLKTNLQAFDPGDTVRVMVRVREGDKERLQAFEGVCIARRGAGINQTFTVRKISAGVGVERIFPLHSPSIAEIELLRKGRVRRAKLYFLRPRRQSGADPREARRRGPGNGGEAGGVRGPRPTLEREIAFWEAGGGLVAGVDEAGRGPLAGPVVAAAVVLPPHCKVIRGLRDSKLLPPPRRLRLAGVVRARALAVGVGAASVREIDRLNIRRASILAMRRALARLRLTPGLVLVDGLPCPELGCAHDAIIDGDAHCHSIAAASVIAKTVRDRLMELLARHHPSYAWESNKGYGTPDHLAALAAWGFTPHHRKSFAPVVQLELIGRQ